MINHNKYVSNFLSLQSFLTPKEIVFNGLLKNIEANLYIGDSTVCDSRGVFARENIPKNTYICEYRGDVLFSRKDLQSREEEYTINDEGSFIMFTRRPNGSFLAVDVTNSIGRLINHHPKNANIKQLGPYLIRNKWRIGFVSIKSISKGDELLYDYGVCGQSWLSNSEPWNQ